MKQTFDEYQASLPQEVRLNEEYLEARSLVRPNSIQDGPRLATAADIPPTNAIPQRSDRPLSILSQPFTPSSMAGVAQPTKSTVALKKDMYINMLVHYDTTKARDCMIRFRELFFPKMHSQGMNEPRSVKNVMMTCFGFELELLKSVIEHSKKFLLYNDSSDAQLKEERMFMGHENMTLIMPAKPSQGWGSGAFHPKLWLIEFENGTLRVVVGSGNLSIGDWSVWSNCLWYQDFQKKVVRIGSSIDVLKEADSKLGGPSSDFYPYLGNFVDKLTENGKEKTKKYCDIDLEQFDFDVPIFPVLVASVPGKHPIYPSGPFCYGLDRLRQIMVSYKRSKPLMHPDVRITYQSSSLGSITAAFLIKFLDSMLPNQKCFLNPTQLGDIFNVVFPSQDYINKSPFKDFSNCLFLSSKSVTQGKDTHAKPGFIRGAMAAYESGENFDYKSAVPHLKVCVVTDKTYEVTDDTIIYLGSHNFTPSAWGKAEKGDSVLNVTNTELGVVFPPLFGSAARKKLIVADLPFRFPPRKFAVLEHPPFFNAFFASTE